MLQLPMKSLRNPARAKPPFRRKATTALLGGAVLLLLAVGWTALLPAQNAAEKNAADLISTQLPEKKTLKSAGKMEFLGAVCAAVRRRRADVPAITQAAVQARREMAGEIVAMVLRCSGKANCETTGAIVAAAVAADGEVSKVSDAAIAKAPNCAETIREATQRGAKTTEPKSAPEQASPAGPGNGREEAFDPHEPLQLVCQEGTQRAVRRSELDDFMKANPAAFLGPCQSSPSTNR